MPGTAAEDAAPAPSSPAGSPGPRLLVDLDWRSAVVLFAAFAALVALTGLLRTTPRGLTWLVIGGLLALALNSLVNAFKDRLGCSRTTAVATILGSAVVALVVVGVLLGPPTIREARALQDDVPEIVDDLTELPFVGQSLADNDVPDRVEQWLSDLPDHLAGDTTTIEHAGRSIARGAIALFMVTLITVSLLIDGSRLARGSLRLVPLQHRARAERAGDVLYLVVGRYFAGSVFVAVLHGLFILVVGLVLGVPLTPLLALWVMVFNLVPQIGGAVGGIPFVLFALTQGATIGVIAGVLYVAWLLFENHVLTPIIVGQAVDLSPATTMVAAIVGVSVAGVPGALVAIPLLGAGKALYVEVRPPPEGATTEKRERFSRLRRLFRRS